MNGFPWGGKNSCNSDSYFDGPNTGVVRTYDFTFSRGTVAPDGFTVDTILINGQYPGVSIRQPADLHPLPLLIRYVQPLIEANWGDTIQVTVHNQINDPGEGTSFHVHGLNQQFTGWEDGVVAVSQCPISPGSSFTQTFKATPHGSTFYHSHYSSQYAGGLWGPVVIHGPWSHNYDIDLGPITLNDYFHRDYFSVLKDIMGSDLSKARPASDNNLLNGKMSFNCSTTAGNGNCVDDASLSKFRFKSSRRHLLRLMNTGIQGVQKFSIDGHTMTVIANDFVPVRPYDTNIVTLGVSISGISSNVSDESYVQGRSAK